MIAWIQSWRDERAWKKRDIAVDHEFNQRLQRLMAIELRDIDLSYTAGRVYLNRRELGLTDQQVGPLISLLYMRAGRGAMGLHQAFDIFAGIRKEWQ